MWNTNWKQFRAKFESQYPTIIDYIQAELINQYKEKIIRYQTNRTLHFGTRAISRGEVDYGILKNDLGNSRGDLKEVVDKFYLLLSRIYDSIRHQEAQESRKVI